VTVADPPDDMIWTPMGSASMSLAPAQGIRLLPGQMSALRPPVPCACLGMSCCGHEGALAMAQCVRRGPPSWPLSDQAESCFVKILIPGA
jgi:hypothetical protein